MVLLPAEGGYLSENASGPLVGDQGIESHQISATHHPEGVVIAAGGPFAGPGTKLAGEVWDIAPTVLRAVGAPLPRGLDGRVIEAAFEPSWLSAHPATFAEGESGTAPGAGELPADEVREIIGNLEGLGYF
jgi:hypothetical protein